MSFVYAQLANVLAQIVRYYPTTTLIAHTNGFTFPELEGTPVELYSSPDATYGGLFIIEANGLNGAIPLQTISTVTFRGGIAYNPAISFLPKPIFPSGFDTNIVTAFHDYLPVGTPVIIYMGTVVNVPGVVYKNVYGMLVVADDMSGINPSFIPVTNITGILPN
jgi:hypothetical protein